MSRYLISYVDASGKTYDFGVGVIRADWLNKLNVSTLKRLGEILSADNIQIISVQKLDERKQKRRKATKKVGWK